jgi:hypothetical protein
LLLLQVVLENITFNYDNPATVDSCDQFTERTVFSLQQLFPNGSIERAGPNAFFVGEMATDIRAMDGATNETGQ